jgi:hypothetical protein
VLSDEEAVRLAEWGKVIEAHYAKPMDIEWAKDGETDALYILQARAKIRALLEGRQRVFHPQPVRRHRDHCGFPVSQTVHRPPERLLPQDLPQGSRTFAGFASESPYVVRGFQRVTPVFL